MFQAIWSFVLNSNHNSSSTSPSDDSESFGKNSQPVRNVGIGEYLPTLDGLRAIAALMVIAFHDWPRKFGSVSFEDVQAYGYLGVDLFFAISGFLITHRLIREEQALGTIDIKAFYVRRLFRIQPAALLYLATLLGLHLLFGMPLSLVALLSCLLLFRNYLVAPMVSADIVYTNHFWSLSVEEHFYLVMPGLIKGTRRYRVALLIGLILLAYLWQLLTIKYEFLRSDGYRGWHTDNRLNCLLIPSLFAVIYTKLSNPAQEFKLLHPFIAIAFLILVLTRDWPKHLDLLLIPLGFCLLVISFVTHSSSTFGKVLEWAPLRFIGRISFGLYLWQQLFFQGRAQMLSGGSFAPTVPWADNLFLNLFGTFACATLSHYLIEKPLIKLGHQIANRVRRKTA